MAGESKYSCRNATETLDWIHAIIDFLKPYRFFFETHVVNFFKDRLWEALDREWINCLRNEPVEYLLQIPSGVVQDHWPSSLKQFVLMSKSLSVPREQIELEKEFPDMQMTSLDKVLTQGMNHKKKHEIEALAAVITSVARSVGANTVIDVGAGQGYLAQVLSFQYRLPVFAIDACSHHGQITDARAERIKKHYAAKMHKLRSEDNSWCIPKTITCHVLSTDTLKSLSNSLSEKHELNKSTLVRKDVDEQTHERFSEKRVPSPSTSDSDSSLVLAGLHACGDLSVTMLRTFLECKEVKAVVSIGCCYNLLSEKGVQCPDSRCGFPMSNGMKSADLTIGKSARDLACQSAERWKVLRKEAGLHNFELHAFRAAFQMVLSRHYPEILITSPTIGRQGKALRRQQQRRNIESALHHNETSNYPSLSCENCETEGIWPTQKCAKTELIKNNALETAAFLSDVSSKESSKREGSSKPLEKCLLFMNFSRSGLSRLGLQHLQDIDLVRIWKETSPFIELVGPYWSLRAALGPVLETLLLLDRLLFLQEQGDSVEAVMLPIFDPMLSPRNMALIAKKI